MLDGKYEIISQHELAPRGTLFQATAPDGTAVQLTWYDLTTPDEEAAFERYRALLRQLRRRDRAAIYDLVARPGAHYVAWRGPTAVGTRPPEPSELAELQGLLEPYGKRLEDAQVCAEREGRARVYALPFEGSLPATAPAPDDAAQPAPRDTPWTRWAKLRPYLPGLLLALTGALLLSSSLYRTLHPGLVRVPEVRGQEIGAAMRELHALGFAVSPLALSSEEPTGQVLEVEPGVGTQLRPGRTVSLHYALPAGQFTPREVPDVRTATLPEAERALEAQGFEVSETARIHSDLEVGRVIAQTPSAGAAAPSGSRVALLVSDGPKGETTFLPNLEGRPLNEALALAELAGFAPDAVEVERVSGAGEAVDTVLAQNLAPNLPVPKDRARLRLTVSGGEARALVSGVGTPDLIGLPLDEAQRAARAAGLRVVEEARVSTPDLPEGVVLQRPAPGRAPQEPVRVTVNLPPEPPRSIPLPTAVATVQGDEVRRVRYAWLLEPGIPEQLATVRATTLSGETSVVGSRRVRGGERIGGVWLTDAPGPVTFSLTLNGVPYGEPLRVNP